MNTLSDSALLDRWIRSRDPISFREITLRHASMVYATCKRILGDPLDAEDIAQECFLALAQTRDCVQSLPAWLHTLAVRRSWNAVRNEKRRRARERRYALEAPQDTSPAAGAIDADTEWKAVQERVDESIAELPEDLRETIIAYFLEGKSQADIAAQQNVNQATVSRRVARGIELVRGSLDRKKVGVSLAALTAMLEARAVESAPPTLISTLGKLALTAAYASPAPAAVAAGLLAHKSVLALIGIVAAGIAGIGVVAHERHAESRAKIGVQQTATLPRAADFQETQVAANAHESSGAEPGATDAAPSSPQPTPTAAAAAQSVQAPEAAKRVAPKGKASLSGRVIKHDASSGSSVLDAISYVGAKAAEWTGYSTAAGSKVLLITLDAVDQYETDVATDGSFSFTNIPGATYFLSLAPPDEEAIDSGYGGWRLIDLGENEQRSNVLLLTYRWKDKDSGTIHASLDVPMLESGLKWYDFFSQAEAPSWSTLSPEAHKQADADYAAQHDAWLDVRTVSANYRWTTRWMEHGEWSQTAQAAPRTGTFAYELVPLTLEEAQARGRGVQVQQRWSAYDNELKCHAVADDIFAAGAKITYCQDGQTSPDQPRQGMLPSYIFKEIPSLMAMSYQTPTWNNNQITREQFLKYETPAMRLSTENERETLLGGETCFMFFAYLAQPRLWISTTSGKIYQCDWWEPKRAVMGSYRYERYFDDSGSGLNFPSRIVYSTMDGTGADKKGTEQVIELSGIHINPELPPETFQAK